MNNGRELRTWTLHIDHTSLPIQSLICTIIQQPISIRKVILAACRVQPPSFHSHTRFHQRHRSILLEHIAIHHTLSQKDPDYYLPLVKFLSNHTILFSTSVLCGFVSMLIRYLPYADYSSSNETRQDTLDKEIAAATTIYHPVSLNYSSIFGRHSDRESPLYLSVSSPQVSSEINIGLRDAKRSLSHGIHVPQVSTKTVMVDSVAYSPFEHVLRQSRPITTLLDIEEVYCRSGCRLGGRTEMRSAWKGNDLKPRVYYARGADVHFASSVIQKLFNAFVDALPNVHRKNRFSLSDLELMNPGSTLLIYDYSSFTSTLHEIINFTRELANFCRGTSITILDGHLGPMQADLGDILDLYNQECNMGPEFDASQLLDLPDTVFTHNCGMLGVPGNITSCTLLHGIHLAILLGSLHRGKVIGDDALAMFDRDIERPRETMSEAIGTLGRIALEKMEFWDDEDSHDVARWTYEKRPLERQHEVVFKGTLFTWPSINLTANILNPQHRPLWKSPSSLFRLSCRQFSRFQSDLFHLTLSQMEKDLILRHLRAFYRRHGLKFWNEGFVGELEVYGDVVAVSIPPCNENFFALSPRDLLRMHWGSWIWLPPSNYDLERASCLGIGSRFDAYGDPVLNYLRKMGFFESERIAVMTLIEDVDPLVLDQFLMGVLRFPYSYCIVDSLPVWSLPLLSQYSSMD